jgi:hypothetical protein
MWFALRKLRPTSEDSNQLSPVGLLGSSPWLYIQSEALQDIAFHLLWGPSPLRPHRAGPGGRCLEEPRSCGGPESYLLQTFLASMIL